MGIANKDGVIQAPLALSVSQFGVDTVFPVFKKFTRFAC
jgi:hypothetical protein